MLVEQAPDAIVVVGVVHQQRFVEAENVDVLMGAAGSSCSRPGPGTFAASQPDGVDPKVSMDANIAEALAGGCIVKERLIKRDNGDEIDCEMRLVLLPSTSRRLVRASFVDITERKRAERAVQTVEKRFRVSRLFTSSL